MNDFEELKNNETPLSTSKGTITTNDVKAVLFGVAVGDALGVPVEFQSIEAPRQNPVRDGVQPEKSQKKMKYISILDRQRKPISATEAIIRGQAPDGGLYVPASFPRLTDYIGKSYQEIAQIVLEPFLPEYSKDELADCISCAYAEDLPVKLSGNFLELYHGKTFSFKDVALQLYPHLLKLAKEKQKIKEDIVILAATSGDTGPAVLAGAANVDGLFTIVLFPKNGVSSVQKLQMTTQTGNVATIEIDGNYDDAQKAVRKLLADEEFKNKFKGKKIFTTASSINIARLLPQMVYYFWSYSELVKNGKINDGEKINFATPSGNFGNALAGFYAFQMQLPVCNLIIACNENKILFDFFKTGVYDKNREFKLTHSTAMDILHVTNLPRAFYNIYGVEKTIEACNSLNKTGKFYLHPKTDPFWAYFATDEQTRQRIKTVFEETGYVMDPHTAVAESVYQQYVKETGCENLTIILSTASPYKFSDVVELSIEKELPQPPMGIRELYEKEVVHTRFLQNTSIEAIKQEIEKILT